MLYLNYVLTTTLLKHALPVTGVEVRPRKNIMSQKLLHEKQGIRLQISHFLLNWLCMSKHVKHQNVKLRSSKSFCFCKQKH